MNVIGIRYEARDTCLAGLDILAINGLLLATQLVELGSESQGNRERMLSTQWDEVITS